MDAPSITQYIVDFERGRAEIAQNGPQRRMPADRVLNAMRLHEITRHPKRKRQTLSRAAWAEVHLGARAPSELGRTKTFLSDWVGGNSRRKLMRPNRSFNVQHRRTGSSGIASGLQQGGTKPLDKTGVTMGSEGTGGGSTEGRATGSAKTDDQTRRPPTRRP